MYMEIFMYNIAGHIAYIKKITIFSNGPTGHQCVYYLPIVVALRIVAAVIMPIEEIASSQPLLPPLQLLQLDFGKPAEIEK